MSIFNFKTALRVKGVVLCALVVMGATRGDLDESIAALMSDNYDSRREAAERLIRAGATAVKPLEGVLRQGKPAARKEAAFVLGAIGGPDARKVLIETLKDEDPDVRMAATWGLVQQGGDSVPELIATLGSQNREAVFSAEMALTKIGSPAVPQITRALETADNKMCRKLIRILGKIGSPEARQTLEKTLKHPDETVRKDAADALSRLNKTN